MTTASNVNRDRFSALSRVLLVAGAALVLVGAAGYARAAFEQASLKDRWEEMPTLPAGTGLVGGERAVGPEDPGGLGEGDPVARLRIPRIGLDAVVLEGISEKTLAVAPGHYPGMALPGEGGHVVLSAHRDSFFREVGRLDEGDAIHLEATDGGTVSYRVSRTYIVHKSNRTVIVPRDEEVLTLITCYPFTYVGAAPYRFIVEALPAQPAASGAS
jgi:LPXTG-site transpeptidase (sortase) family protein